MDIRPTPETVKQCIVSAASSDPSAIQAGTHQLEKWRQQDNFYPSLQSVYLDTSLPYESRQLALIILKNGIDKQWHRSGKNPICPEDKEAVRDKLLFSSIQETDSRLVLHNALIVGKIARYDYPSAWPDAVQTILSIVENPPSPIALKNILSILYRVVKEYSSHRLPRHRLAFREMCENIVGPLYQVYVRYLTLWNEGVESNDGEKANYGIDIGTMCLKTLSQVMIQDYESVAFQEQISNIWVMFYNNFCHVIKLINASKDSGTQIYSVAVEKYAYKLAKLHMLMANSLPMAFARLPNTMDLMRVYWGEIKGYGESYGINSSNRATEQISQVDPSSEKDIRERLVLMGLQLLRVIMKMAFAPVSTFKFLNSSASKNIKMVPELIKTKLLTESFVNDMLDTLISQYFQYTALDFYEWENSPEEWTLKQDEASADYLYAVRPCAERLFTEIVTHYKEFVTNTLTQICQTAAVENSNVFQKDSLYTALGLGAAVVQTSFDFGEFMRNVLLKEIQADRQMNCVIRRRVPILIAQWITVSIQQSDKELVYKIFSFLLDPSDKQNDIVVRMTAASNLRLVVDEWDFNVEQFKPYVDPILSNLMELIQNSEYESQPVILQTIGAIVERLDVAILPFADKVMSLLWGLAEKYPDQTMTKQSIISILGQIVQSTKAQSIPYHQHCFPIVVNTLSSGDDEPLAEDVLDLWAILIHNTPTPLPVESAPLVEMIKLLPPIIEKADDSLATACTITEAYITMIPEVMKTTQVRLPFFISIGKVLGGHKAGWHRNAEKDGESLRSRVQGQFFNLVELIATEVMKAEREDEMSLLIADLVESGVFNSMMCNLRGSYIARTYVTTVEDSATYDTIKTSEGGGRWVWDTVDSLVVVDSCLLLSRLALGSPKGLYEAISRWSSVVLSSPFPPPGPQFSTEALEKEVKDYLSIDNVSWVLHELFHTIEYEASTQQRRTMCIATTRMLKSSEWQNIDLLGNFMAMWADVLFEAFDVDAAVGRGGLEFRANQLDTIIENESPGTFRARDLRLADPTYKINIKEPIRDCISWLVEAMGGQEGFKAQIAGRVDSEVLDQLEKALAAGE